MTLDQLLQDTKTIVASGGEFSGEHVAALFSAYKSQRKLANKIEQLEIEYTNTELTLGKIARILK